MLSSLELNARLPATLCGTALSLCLVATFAQQPIASPDIFLVTIDTLRADHVHCYGYERAQTPALDALASDGLRFANAFTPSPITTSSHVSILTGLLPSVHGVTDFGMPLSPDHVTLAQLLRDRGYQTAAFIGAVVLDSRALAPGLDRGFNHYDNFPERPKTQARWGRLERRAMDVAGRAESWLASHPGRPRFVWLHLYDPHDPYEPPPPFAENYKDRLYDGEIAYADSAVAHFVSYLKQHGLYRNSVVVAVGDHGEGLGEHGEDTHGIFLYDSTTHVPLIVKLPSGNARNRTVEAQVRTVDILPTVLDVTHAPVPAALNGESLRPYFSSGEVPTRVAFGETDYPLGFGWAPLRSVRTDGFKFIEAPHPEYYQLRSDPKESDNQYEPWQPGVQKSRELLAKLRETIPPAPRPTSVVPPQTIAELRALGYLGRADAGSSTSVPAPSLLPDPKDKIELQNRIHRAMIASEGGHPDVARSIFEQVLRLDPNSYAALLQLAELELNGGRYERAMAHLSRARALHPDDPVAALVAGRALQKAGDLQGASEALATSLKLMPGQLQAHLLLGNVFMQLKTIARAEDEFQAALVIEPNNTTAKLSLARAHAAGGKFEEVVDDLTELTKANWPDPAVFQLLGQAYRALGKIALAEQTEARGRALLKRK